MQAVYGHNGAVQVGYEQSMIDRPQSVLISIANPSTAAGLVHVGTRIAGRTGGAIVLLHVSVASTAEDASEVDAQKVLDEAASHAESSGVPVRTAIHKAPSIADGIIYGAQDEHIDYLIMGWRGDMEGQGTVIGDNIDSVIRESNSHTIVVQRGSFKEAERVLVPVANPHTAPVALAVASQLRGDDGPDVSILHFSPRDLSKKERESFRAAMYAFAEQKDGNLQRLVTDTSQFEIVYEAQTDPARELAERSDRYDRMVLGTSRSGYGGNGVFSALLLQIAHNARCPVIFVRPKEAGAKFGYQT